MSALLEEKRRELEALQRQEQAEFEGLCVDRVKAAFKGKNVIFSEKLAKISVVSNVTASRFLNSSLQGGPSSDELFRMTLHDGTVLKADYERNTHPESWTRLFVSRSRGGEAPDSISVDPVLEFSDEITEDWKMGSASLFHFLGVAADATFDESMVVLGTFWSHLEAALTIYMAHMRKCPDQSRWPCHQDLFTRLFAHLKMSG